MLSTAARVSRLSRLLSAYRVALRPINPGRVGVTHEPKRRYQQSVLDPQTGPHPSLLFAPGKLVNALCYVDIEPRICRCRALDQALNALRVLLALGEHCLGAADGKVVYQRSSRLLRLDEGHHSVQRLCQRSILRDGYAGKSCRHGIHSSTAVQHQQCVPSLKASMHPRLEFTQEPECPVKWTLAGED